MAKKGQQAQLQFEITTDEELEKFISQDGLILADIYSEWCGPCIGMQANLKKIKMEKGGDLLHLVTIRADSVKAVERFKGKSEPTWMFISRGRMIRLIFGANAPNLMRAIEDELKKEEAAGEGPLDRETYDISEVTPEEKDRKDSLKEKIQIAEERERLKLLKEDRERRDTECKNILDNTTNLAVCIIFPSAKEKYGEVLTESLAEAALNINQVEKVTITPEMIQEINYFAEEDLFNENEIEEMTSGNISIALLLKPGRNAQIDEDIYQLVLQMIYGDMRKPPGDPDSVAVRLRDKINHVEHTEESVAEEEDETREPSIQMEADENELVLNYIWTPPNDKITSSCIKIFFPKIVENQIIHAPPPPPDHLAFVFGFNKKDLVFQLMEKHHNEIMRYGFFTSGDPEKAKLVAKNPKQYSSLPSDKRTYKEKIVLQISRKKSECVLDFAQLNPEHMSPNVVEGKVECSEFFPDDYDQMDDGAFVKEGKEEGEEDSEGSSHPEEAEGGEEGAEGDEAPETVDEDAVSGENKSNQENDTGEPEAEEANDE